MDPRVIGVSAALGSAAAWAVGSIIFKKITENVSPFGMTLAKGVLSVLLLGLGLVATGIDPVDWGPLVLLVVSGLLGIAAGDTLFFAALGRLSPFVLIVFFMMGQGLTAVLAVILLGEMPSLVTWVGIAIALAGVTMVMVARYLGDQEKRTSTVYGLVLGALSMLCMSLSDITAKEGLATVSDLEATFIRMAAGTVGVFLVGVATGQVGDWLHPVRRLRVASQFLLGVSVVTFGGFWLTMVAFKHVHVVVAKTLGATEALFMLPLAAFWLRERIRFQELVGTVVATIGVAIICRG